MIEPLDGEALDRELERGALLVDARSIEAHAAQRVPGSLSVPAGSSFGTWLGWVVDPDRPVVLLVDDLGELDGIARQALRIGFDSIVGHVAGGMRGWRAAGRAVQAGSLLDVDRLAAQLARGGAEAPFVIDVRQASEYEAGHVPGSVHIGAGELPAKLDELPRDRPIVDDLRERLPLQRRRLAAACRGLRACRRGGRRRPDLGGPRLPARLRPGGRRRMDGRRPRWPPSRTPTSRLSPARTPNAPSAATPSSTASRTTTMPTADQASVFATRPLRCSPISRRSLISRTMNTSTTGSSSPCRYCEPRISGSRSRPGTSTISAPAASTNV